MSKEFSCRKVAVFSLPYIGYVGSTKESGSRGNSLRDAHSFDQNLPSFDPDSLVVEHAYLSENYPDSE